MSSRPGTILTGWVPTQVLLTRLLQM
ncbi:hypothetical protein HID58_046661 [Brassica napus]|uniref:Uncharacterized protein n=1 Tax=Brassica napus TaxID=3708 RepID=A0ABQ8AX87_BRANA|nr:hypothetical protein HID58_046661 [Brassica napus]